MSGEGSHPPSDRTRLGWPFDATRMCWGRQGRRCLCGTTLLLGLSCAESRTPTSSAASIFLFVPTTTAASSSRCSGLASPTPLHASHLPPTAAVAATSPTTEIATRSDALRRQQLSSHQSFDLCLASQPRRVFCRLVVRTRLDSLRLATVDRQLRVGRPHAGPQAFGRVGLACVAGLAGLADADGGLDQRRPTGSTTTATALSPTPAPTRLRLDSVWPRWVETRRPSRPACKTGRGAGRCRSDETWASRGRGARLDGPSVSVGPAATRPPRHGYSRPAAAGRSRV
ncbi:unnamed protein product [Protopolystoma xenopodis]|uniref:Uncharacterized protein n=1 Tax=Protopolystoma xenopodis TaxID=117903 RepID=A0A448X408_9PLAT|nr:unnamed protein product [Protopolystoma xenopodis]